ncbi:hypothetical protein [Streptomyces radiopugnans]|uniref:Uncharacterized protein n=1 Tax=Streptomyces radiopugnans TaxID=403935 RepID=A0A1H8ZKX2_9ACTN|nr:hypothetical protein [Streptomyces radiopugnans]SEP65030.1 hypothetical protein SAMN05216481_101593 [Streptomyces radiopugnans]
MFGRSKARQQAAQAEYDRKATAAMAELGAKWEQEAAQAREAKWDRIVRNMTVRGEDHEGRDYAIRARENARSEARDAETRRLGAKFRI